MTAPWSDMEPVIRDRAYARINDMPELLLETDSWFTVDADIIYARLLGFEDEIVQDGLRLPEAVPEIRMGIPQRLTLASRRAEDLLEIEPMRTASYRLQSCFVTLAVSGFVTDPPVEKLRDDYTAVVAYLRYRRRS